MPDDEITAILREYIQDYKCHVFDIPRLSMEKMRQFRSDFRVVAEYFVNAYTNPNYIADDIVITHVDEFLKLMQVLTGDNRYEEVAQELTGEEKEGVRMCNVLDAREAKGEARGRAEGRAEGKIWMLVQLTKDGIITMHTAAEKANMSEEEFKEIMETMTL